MQPTAVLLGIEPVKLCMDMTQQSWDTHPECTSIAEFAVGPLYHTFYLPEFTELVEQYAGLHPSKSPQPRQNTFLYDQNSLCGLPYDLQLPTALDNHSAMKYVVERSCFARSFSQILCRGITIEALLAQLTILKAEYDADPSSHPEFTALYSTDTTFSIQIQTQRATLPRIDQAVIRNSLLHILSPTARVSLDSPTTQYTLFISCYQFDHHTLDAEIIEQNKPLPYAFYFTKQICVKSPQGLNPSKYKIAARPYKGSTCCPEILSFLMANLSGVQPETTVLEAFTGTGSIQIACAVFSRCVTGQDLDLSQLLGAFKDKQKKREMKLRQLQEKLDAEKYQAEIDAANGIVEDPKSKKRFQMRGICKQEDYNIHDNFNFYGLPRPELVNADNSNQPYRLCFQNTENTTRTVKQQTYTPHAVTIPQFRIYRTRNGKPLTDWDNLCYEAMMVIEKEYMNNTVLPQKRILINNYCAAYNDRMEKLEELAKNGESADKLEQGGDNKDANPQMIIPLEKVLPSFDMIICDPPFGIKVKSSSLTSSDPKNKGQSSFIAKTKHQRKRQLDAESMSSQTPNNTKNIETCPENMEIVEDNTEKCDGNTENPHIRRRKYTEIDISLGRYFPTLKPTPPHEIIYQLFDNASKHIKMGGKLTFLLPTAKVIGIPLLSSNIETPGPFLPEHPCFKRKYACVQPLPTWYNRWCLVYEKTMEYDPSHHSNWVSEQKKMGVPLWSLHTAAKARLLANYKHFFDLSLLFESKRYLDENGFNEDFDETGSIVSDHL